MSTSSHATTPHARKRGKPRREPRRIELAGRGFAVFVVLAILLGLAYLRTSGAIGGDPEVTAQVRNAGGSLRSGSDVKVAGVIVGKVRDITRGPDGDVQVSMAMAEDHLDTVPENVMARILPATVFGTSFVDLVVDGSPNGRTLEAGADIPADTTQSTLELQQALDDIDRLVKALGPAELQSAISSAATALEGRGRKIGSIIDVADAYLAKVTPQLPLARSDLRKLADNLAIVDDLAPDLLDATRDGLVTLDTVVDEQDSIASIISGGTTLARTGDAFLDDNVDPLVHVLDNAQTLLDTLYDNREVGITGGLAINLRLGERLPTAIREGFIVTDATFNANAPDLYTAADRPDYGRSEGRSR